MKIKSLFIQLLTIGLLTNLTTGCKNQEEVIAPKTVEECPFFTAKFTKAQVWEVRPEGELTPGEDWTLNIVGPATISSDEGTNPLDWGTSNDRYMQFKIEDFVEYGEIIDDINNYDSSRDTYAQITTNLYEKNGTLIEDVRFESGSIVGRCADGFVYFMHSPEYYSYYFFSTKPLSNPSTITIKPAKGYTKKLSELTDGLIEIQSEKLNKVLPTAGGVSKVVFKQGATYGTMTDLNGNTYKTITIGTQTWMAENLRTTKYRNGESISIVNIGQDWIEQTTGACCSRYNTTDKNLIATQGLLYNGYAATDSRSIAPQGWHIPTDAEWKTLIAYLGGEAVAGSKLKEAGTTNWMEMNTDATNFSGFSATNSGARNNEQGEFNSVNSANFWTSTLNPEYEESTFIYIVSSEDSNASQSSAGKANGFSIRLIKD